MNQVIKIFAAVLGMALLNACSAYQGPQGLQGVPGAAGPIQTLPTPSGTLTVAQLVAEQNAYRESVGQEDLIPGLNCALYTVPQTTTQIIGATLTGVGNFEMTSSFNTPNQSVNVGMNFFPVSIQTIFTSWYIVKCTGNLVMADSNWHGFSLSSDDGSNLYVDGLLINNDGLHGIQTKTAVKFLQYGFHSFELDFFQGSGNEALILDMDNVLLSSGFYH